MRNTNERQFSRRVKEAVAARDSIDGYPCCIYCGKPAPTRLAFSNAHFISRGQGGLGIEENCLTLCQGCHRRYDQSHERDEMRKYFRQYLAKNYPHWDEGSLGGNKRC